MADDKKIIFSMVGVSKAFQANKQATYPFFTVLRSVSSV